MRNATVQTAKKMALEIRDRCRIIAKSRGLNPRFWKSVFEELARGSDLKITSIRRLLYSAKPRTHYATVEKMEQFLEKHGGPPDMPSEPVPSDRPIKAAEVSSQPTIEGVLVKELRHLPDARGYLLEILRADDFGFFGEEAPFGQAYLTCVYPGVVKAWHAHQKQADRICCVSGMARLALYDDRPGSPTRGSVNHFVLGELSPKLVLVPAGVWHGFAAVGPEPALVLNIPTRPYDYRQPDELRLDPHQNDIPFDWKRIDG